MNSNNTITRLKEEYVAYYSDVPVQKYAAMSIARDEDTIIRWRREDSEFADAVQRAKAGWIRKKVLATKAEFALERLEKEVFSPHSTTSLQPSAYDTFVKNHNYNPNTPENREKTDRITAMLMEDTKTS
ncbi:MAG: hypothetical protein NTX11_01990 [Candidatus Saccharibacteria bacterium]|nr:hypothetical protein [Candidatus Saccharibacteria bacterium]